MKNPINMSSDELQSRFETARAIQDRMISRRLDRDFKNNVKKINCLVIGILGITFISGFILGRFSKVYLNI